MAKLTLSNPDKAAERLIGMRPPADREIIRRPEVMAVLRENLPNQFKDPASMALEMRNAARPWGFDLQEVTVPTTMPKIHCPARLEGWVTGSVTTLLRLCSDRW